MKAKSINEHLSDTAKPVRLIRLAAFFFSEFPQSQSADYPKGREYSLVYSSVNRFGVDIDIVSNTNLPDGSHRVLVAATKELSTKPYVDQRGLLHIDPQDTRSIEETIEMTRDPSAFFSSCSSILSPMPCFGLKSEDASDYARWDLAKGVSPGASAAVGVRPDVPLEFKDHIMDRLDGIRLMSAYLRAGSILGRYSELMRLFENAFSVSSSRLVRALFEFLDTNPIGLKYTFQEVDSFARILRDRARHADRASSSNILFERDVWHLMPRVRQAAYDVLLNKSKWHSEECGRRNLWNPPGASLGGGDLLLVLGKAAVLAYGPLLDDFGSYPWDMRESQSELPDGWWTMRSHYATDDASATSEL